MEKTNEMKEMEVENHENVPLSKEIDLIYKNLLSSTVHDALNITSSNNKYKLKHISSNSVLQNEVIKLKKILCKINNEVTSEFTEKTYKLMNRYKKKLHSNCRQYKSKINSIYTQKKESFNLKKAKKTEM